MSERGQWPGGRPPFWLEWVSYPGGKGKYLRLHPEHAPVMLELVERVLAGESQGSVFADFNRRELPGAPWNQNSGKQLRNSLLIGTGRLGDEKYAEPLLKTDSGEPDMARFTALQARLDEIALDKKYRRRDSRLLSRVLFCGVCGKIRHYHVARKDHLYVVCSGRSRIPRCTASALRAELVHQYVEHVFPLVVEGELAEAWRNSTDQERNKLLYAGGFRLYLFPRDWEDVHERLNELAPDLGCRIGRHPSNWRLAFCYPKVA